MLGLLGRAGLCGRRAARLLDAGMQHAGVASAAGQRSPPAGFPYAGYLERLKAALRKGHVRSAERVIKEYEASGRMGPDPSLHNHLLAAYARTRQVDAAFAQAAAMRERGAVPDAFTYSALLNACSKAEHPPYDLPEEHAHRAADVFREMQAAGVAPNHVHFHCLMDAQAKAGLLEAALATFVAMRAGGLPPSTLTLNILVSACARVGDAQKAQDLMAALQAEGVALDSTTWNSLLGAHARGGDVDGAYATWAQMRAGAVLPTPVTMRVLAQAFQGNATLANELLAEAAEARQQLLAGTPQEAGAKQRRAGGSRAAVPQPLLLDLHGLSVSSARAVLLQRLELLMDTLDIGSRVQEDFQVITGAGRRSKAGQEATLRAAAAALLQAEGLQPAQEPGNTGRLRVAGASLAAYVRRRRRQRDQERLLQYAGWRGVLLAAGLCSAGAAMALVPRLLAATA